jgi:hypothetical protein
VRILFDQGTPVPLRSHLTTHQITTVFELNWGSLTNGELLSKAESANFEILVTTDQNLRYQQNLTKRRIAVVVITSTNWPRIQKRIPAVVDAINRIETGGYVEVAIQ